MKFLRLDKGWLFIASSLRITTDMDVFISVLILILVATLWTPTSVTDHNAISVINIFSRSCGLYEIMMMKRFQICHTSVEPPISVSCKNNWNWRINNKNSNNREKTPSELIFLSHKIKTKMASSISIWPQMKFDIRGVTRITEIPMLLWLYINENSVLRQPFYGVLKARFYQFSHFLLRREEKALVEEKGNLRRHTLSELERVEGESGH